MAEFLSKYSGSEIDELLSRVANGSTGGGGGEVQKTTEAEITAMGFTKNLGTITEVKMNGESKGTDGVVDLGNVITEHQDISGKVDKVTGKGLSTEDFTSALKSKLEGLTNYDDTAISNAVSSLQSQLNTLVSGNANDAINSFNEIIAFLDGVKDTEDLEGIIASIEQQIVGKADKSSLAAVATSGSYNDLNDKPTIPSAVTESTVSGWGFTKNTGTYSKPSAGIPKTDLASDIQSSLGKADTALQSYTEQYKGTITGVSANGTSVATSGVANIPAASTSAYGVTKLSSATNSTSTSLAATASAVKAAYDLANSYKGTVTGVKINGTTKNPSSGVVDLGTVITSHQDISGKQDKLVSGTNIKTINGESILGSGDITISGGGSSGGSVAYSEVNHGTSDTTFILTPNTFHVWDKVASLALTLGSETAGVANEYLFQFTSGSTPTTLTLPDDIKWVNDSTPVIAGNKVYQVSILKGMAIILEFNNASSLIINRGIYDAGDMMSGASLTFEYPVASDLTLAVLHYESNSVVLPKGQTSITLDYFEPAAPEVVGIIPEQDGTYIYEIV